MTENLKKFMQESGFVSIEEVANIWEITATEFSDSKDPEIARDYMIAASTLRQNEKLTKALADCYMLACRRSRGVVTPENADWNHIRRFCESIGSSANILREAAGLRTDASLQTECESRRQQSEAPTPGEEKP